MKKIKNPGPFTLQGLRIFFNARVLVNGVLLFLLVIALPLLDQAFDLTGKAQLVEKRRLARKPRLKLQTIHRYSRKYNAYYNDRFAFRGRLVYLNNLLKVKFLGVSPVSRVVLGKNDWLFLDNTGGRPGTIDYYRSLTLFSPAQLEQWKTLLEGRQKWLADRGCQYLFIIVPNKNTIYPEFMPPRIRKARSISRMDQLLAYLRKHTALPVLDLRPALTAAREKYPVYSRTDTHWNDYGAYVAYREIIEFLSRRYDEFKEAAPFPLTRFQVARDNRPGGDLAIMLSLQEKIFREDMIRLEPLPPRKYGGGSLGRITRFVKHGFTQCKNAPLPNMVMVHDSFYKRLKPFLSSQFSRIVYIWDWDLNFYPGIIDKEKPKLVIDEMAERFLMQKIPKNPSNINK
jgi:hypothetical protein